MQIRRTANAGVLLTLDNVSILLDGVCRVYSPYLAPPPAVLGELAACPPDALVYSHAHPDHFETGFAADFWQRTGRPILGTEGVAESLPGIPVEQGTAVIGGVRVTPVRSRHLGVEWRTYPHVSYLLEGSKRVFFIGDATPACWKDGVSRLQPDVLIAPFPYVTTRLGWQSVERFAPKALVVVHMPGEDRDPDNTWPAVRTALEQQKGIPVWIPGLGETICLP